MMITTIETTTTATTDEKIPTTVMAEKRIMVVIETGIINQMEGIMTIDIHTTGRQHNGSN
jgi:hypothetical protein